MCVCVFVCVCAYIYIQFGSSRSFKHVSLNNEDKFYLYNLFKILSSFLISVLDSGWNWKMNFPKLSRALSNPSPGFACLCNYNFFQTTYNAP